MGDDILKALAGLAAAAAAAANDSDDDKDDTGDPDFPKKYLDEWKVERNCVGTKLKQVLKAFRKVNEAGDDLHKHPSKYNAILQILIRLPFQKKANPSIANRIKFLDALLNEGILSFYKNSWNRLKGQIGGWETLALRPMGQAVLNYGRSLTAMWSAVGIAKESQMRQMCQQFVQFLIEQLNMANMKEEFHGLGNHQGMVVNAMIRILSCMAAKSYDAVEKMRETGGVEIISHYIKHYKDKGIKINSFMLLSCIAQPKHACIKLLEAEGTYINFLIDQLDEAVSSPLRCTTQYDLDDIMPCINNCLRLSPSLNEQFIQLGIVALYTEMLDDSFSTTVTKMAIEGIGFMVEVNTSKEQLKEAGGKQLLEHCAATGVVLCSSAENVMEGL